MHSQLGARRPNEKREHPWFVEYLPLDMRGEMLPEKIVRIRNWAIVALGIQLAATVAGFSFFFLRRVKYHCSI